MSLAYIYIMVILTTLGIMAIISELWPYEDDLILLAYDRDTKI